MAERFLVREFPELRRMIDSGEICLPVKLSVGDGMNYSHCVVFPGGDPERDFALLLMWGGGSEISVSVFPADASSLIDEANGAILEVSPESVQDPRRDS